MTKPKIVPNCDQLEDLFYGPFGNGPGGAFSNRKGKFKERVQFETQQEREVREAKCRALCNSCVLLEACREWALINGEEFGVWGGMTEGERRDFRSWLRLQGYEEIPIRPWLNQYLEVFWFDRYGEEVEITQDGTARVLDHFRNRPVDNRNRNRGGSDRADNIRKGSGSKVSKNRAS